MKNWQQSCCWRELRKATGLTSVGAEYLLHEFSPGVPRVVRWLQEKGLEDLLWQAPDEPAPITRNYFSNKDVWVCLARVVRGQVGVRTRTRYRRELEVCEALLAEFEL